MTIVIRADASPEIGIGHIMRCIALAQAWRRSGGEALFVAAEYTPSVQQRMERERFSITSIACPRGSLEDAQNTIRIASAAGGKWVVADGYCFNSEWQAMVRNAGLKLLLVDDYGSLAGYEADLLLNQNASASIQLYAGRSAVPHMLLGAGYSLLRQEFLTCPSGDRAIPTRATKLLVTLGGSDPDNVTAKVLDAVAMLPEMETTVVVGGSNRHLALLKAATERAGSSVHLKVDAPDMPELMRRADIAFSASGSTVWELAYMGVPAVLAVLAENQAAIAAEMDRRNVAINIGAHAMLSADRIAEAIRSLALDPDRRREMSANGHRLVDGHGASRVAAALGARLRISIVTDADTWMNEYVPEMRVLLETQGHAVQWVHDPAEIQPGDLAFLLSLSRIIKPATLRRNAHNLVAHASALPHGRGMSPLTWQVLEGKSRIPVSLIEAGEAVDSGDIYDSASLDLNGTELISEMQRAMAAVIVRLCCAFAERYPFCLADRQAQHGEPHFYRRRKLEDSRLDPDKTIREQFNLLRVADPERYPAFFEIGGRRFNVRITPV